MTQIKLQRSGPVAVLTLDNPARRNAFTPEMRRSLTAELNALSHDDEVRAIVLTGEGEHFCAGADLSRVGGAAAPPSFIKAGENLKDVHHLARAIVLSPKPIITAVEGDAFGAGLSMVAGSDLAIVARTARFGAAFAKIGIVPDVGLLHSLPNRIGVARTRRLIFMSSMLSGEEAFRIGLADELAESGGALELALRRAEELAQAAPITIALTKGALAAAPMSFDDALRFELMHLPMALASQDSKEGLAAFKEKRKPNFQGR
jgi:enoyl-CoA hydratase/carnithine racemase